MSEQSKCPFTGAGTPPKFPTGKGTSNRDWWPNSLNLKILSQHSSLVDPMDKKFDYAKEKNLEIIFCIGEPKEVREAGIETVMEYLWKQCEGIDLSYDNLIVAYEPVWAIGTGLSATPEDIKETLAYLRKKISKPLLYGGSVKVENVADILNIDNCDGVLVGTASWKVDDFCQMIATADK